MSRWHTTTSVKLIPPFLRKNVRLGLFAGRRTFLTIRKPGGSVLRTDQHGERTAGLCTPPTDASAFQLCSGRPAQRYVARLSSTAANPQDTGRTSARMQGAVATRNFYPKGFKSTSEKVIPLPKVKKDKSIRSLLTLRGMGLPDYWLAL